jgi:hypothetical protein
VALCAAFFILVSVTVSTDPDFTVGRLNVVGAINFLVAIAGGGMALYAMLRRGERSLILFAPVLPALFAIGLEFAEAL